ncbi:MAG: aldose 1-epimerase family protein [Bacteroidota bacterium]
MHTPITHQTTLTSVKENIHLDEWSASHTDLPLDTDAQWSIKKHTLHGGKQEGVDMIELDNGAMRITIIPTRGMSIYDVSYGGLRLGWNSPVKEIVHPQFIDMEDNGGLGWLEGFNEWMTRCGVEFAGHPGEDNGRLLTLHGKIGNIPTSEVQVVIDKEPPHRIRIRGKVHEVFFNGPNLELWTEVSTVPGSNSFRIDDVLTNKGKLEQEFMIIYHANFGPPLLEQGSKLLGTIEKLQPFDAHAASEVQRWDTYHQAKDGFAEQVYCIYPSADSDGNAHFLLHNASADQAVSFTYPKEQLPYLTQWKNENTGGYVTGLEPGTGFPHNRSIERKYGRVPVLKPGASRSFGLEYTIHKDKEEVKAAANAIQNLMQQPPQVIAEVIGK